MFFWYIFGNSPTLEQVWFTLIISMLFVMNAQIIKNSMNIKFFEKRFDNMESNIKDSFNNMKSDISLVKKRLIKEIIVSY